MKTGRGSAVPDEADESIKFAHVNIIHPPWMDLLFLSFTTLSGVGLGDILPHLPMARALVMIEEFSGVMYLALVVSRLIALSVKTRTAR